MRGFASSLLPPKTNVLGREGYYLSVGLMAGIYASVLQMSIKRGTPGDARDARERGFRVGVQNRPNRRTLGKLCHALAEQNVNILAFHSFPLEKGKSSARLILDNPAMAKSILDRQKTDYAETEVAKVTLTHRPGELARAAARLGEAGINIDYGYCGVDPSTNATMLLL